MYVPSPITPHPFPREPKFQSAVKWMLFICVLAIIASYCSGCSKYTPQKAAEQIYKANTYYPDTTAKITRSLYPCTTTQVDTFINWIDTVLNVDCPDSLLKETVYVPQNNTPQGIKTITKTVRIPVQVQLPARTIIKKIEDSAKITVMAGEVTKRDRTISDQQQQIDKQGKKIKGQQTAIIWLALIALVLLFYITRHYWFKVLRKMVNPLA